MMYTIIEYRYIDKIYYLSKAHYDMTTDQVIKYLTTGIIKKNDCISIYAGLSDEVLTIDLLTKTWTRGYTQCDKRLHTFLKSMQEEVEKGGFHIVEHY